MEAMACYTDITVFHLTVVFLDIYVRNVKSYYINKATVITLEWLPNYQVCALP